jgi:hypothetical protein
VAQATCLHRNTIPNIEVGRYAGNQDSSDLIDSVFRKAGVEFLPQNGLRFHEPPDTNNGGRQFCRGLPLSVARSSQVVAPNGLQDRGWRFGGLSTAVIGGPRPGQRHLVPDHNRARVRAAKEVAARSCPFCKRFYGRDIPRSLGLKCQRYIEKSFYRTYLSTIWTFAQLCQ